jgi:signal transduction histidine kinase
VKGLIRAYVDRSRSIEAMWVLNQDGKTLYASARGEEGRTVSDPGLRENLRRGEATITSRQEGDKAYYDVLVPLQMPKGAHGPGGLRLWINPADWSELLSGLWWQLALLFVPAGGVALFIAFLTTQYYSRRFRLITDALREAEAGTYRSRPRYPDRDDVGASLDLIDRLVRKQQGANATPFHRLAMATRTLAHEVRGPLNNLAVNLELLRQGQPSASAPTPLGQQQERSLAVAETTIRQVEQLVRDFSDYAAPLTMERRPVELSALLASALEATGAQCAAQRIRLQQDLPRGPWLVQGDEVRLREIFDNLLRNAVEAQPNGGVIEVNGRLDGAKLTVDIKDGGPGVPPERRSTLFDFGGSTKPGGSGIGLPLSQIIAEAHGGSLEYVTQDGKHRGAIFRFVLPLHETL